jgi:two-component system, chemotaxis family, sensor kinase CheA
MFGLDEVARFTHALESLLDQLRSGGITVTAKLTDVLLRANDVLRELLASASGGTPIPARMQGVLEELYAMQRAPQQNPDASGATQVRQSDREPAPNGPETFCVQFRPAADSFSQGMDPLLILRDLAALGTSAAPAELDLGKLPSLDDLDPERCYLGWKLRISTSKTLEEIQDVFAFVEEGAEIRIEVERSETDSAPAAQPSVVAAPTQAPPRDASIRVATSKVDKLVDLVGELVIAQSMAQEIVRNFSAFRLGELEEAIGQMERHIRELQERVMSVRMLPIGHIFGRFPRLVRDLSIQLSKNVRLEMAGEDTELDKGVVEQMSDPLTHIIRNSIDHGIEPGEERVRNGKPEQGLIRLEAFHQAGSVMVEISDDGRGLDANRIRRKAIERGLIAESDSLSEAQACDLIFSAGFSTAETVSDLSGRGVGLDVVRRNVEALNGSVTLVAQPGKGTRVRIQLPLTLAILDGLSVQVGRETYVVPLVAISESIRPKPEQVKTIAGRGEAVMVRGEPLPLLRLHRLFGIATDVVDPCRGLTVIIEHAGHRFALLVDELLGQQQVVIKSLEAHYRKVEGVLGATILGDGRAALILDAAGLAQISRRSGDELRAA